MIPAPDFYTRDAIKKACKVLGIDFIVAPGNMLRKLTSYYFTEGFSPDTAGERMASFLSGGPK